MIKIKVYVYVHIVHLIILMSIFTLWWFPMAHPLIFLLHLGGPALGTPATG